MAKVSVIIPAYNQAKYLPETLNSVLNQTHKNWECILVNDGSTDDTELLYKIFQKKDDRFIYLFKENGGLASARNCGIRNICGDYIQFLDADDIISSDKFEKQILYIDNHPCIGAVYSNYGLFNNNDIKNIAQYASPKFKSNDILSELVTRWDKDLSIPIHCFLLRNNAIKNITFEEKLPNHEDWYFWIELALNGVKFQFTDGGFAYYRNNPTSLTKNEISMIYGRLLALEMLHIKLKTICKLRMFIKGEIVRTRYRLGVKLLGINSMRPGRKMLFDSIELCNVKGLVMKLFMITLSFVLGGDKTLIYTNKLISLFNRIFNNTQIK